ncbi:MAG: hypothetical protein Q8P13_04770 [bacterium]|nr:hypothetical protein [bacterium]
MITLYERFANKENIENKLTQLDLAEHEREHLLDLLAKIYQQHLLIGLLDLLADDERTSFLEKFYYATETEVIGFLQDRVENLDEKITTLVAELELEVFEMLEMEVNKRRKSAKG